MPGNMTSANDELWAIRSMQKPSGELCLGNCQKFLKILFMAIARYIFGLWIHLYCACLGYTTFAAKSMLHIICWCLFKLHCILCIFYNFSKKYRFSYLSVSVSVFVWCFFVQNVFYLFRYSGGLVYAQFIRNFQSYPGRMLQNKIIIDSSSFTLRWRFSISLTLSF